MSAHTTPGRDSNIGHDTAADRSAGENFLAYLDILRALDEQGAGVNSALLEAHTATTVEQRRTALTRLHARLRNMAATANDALGNWPDPGDVPA
ncbi:hypothetical protein [Nucisporomicrobium flavum]|uniref:hypothetical protein n=1 Tax=Nucisporomicrobium flavum TaxID=2785915 RepID=UPI0018F5ACB3|nr:hypothetical protein [Nucisporomicrobium flavum]